MDAPAASFEDALQDVETCAAFFRDKTADYQPNRRQACEDDLFASVLQLVDHEGASSERVSRMLDGWVEDRILTADKRAVLLDPFHAKEWAAMKSGQARLRRASGQQQPVGAPRDARSSAGLNEAASAHALQPSCVSTQPPGAPQTHAVVQEAAAVESLDVSLAGLQACPMAVMSLQLVSLVCTGSRCLRCLLCCTTLQQAGLLRLEGETVFLPASTSARAICGPPGGPVWSNVLRVERIGLVRDDAWRAAAVVHAFMGVRPLQAPCCVMRTHARCCDHIYASLPAGCTSQGPGVQA
jgi:hypothetical protein